MARKKETIHYIRENETTNQVIGNDGTVKEFEIVTQNVLYSELIKKNSCDHIYQIKWIEEEKDLHDIFFAQIQNMKAI